MCEAPQNLRSLALLSPESKAVRCCVLDHNSDAVHSMQLERTSPVHRRDEVLRLFAATRSALANTFPDVNAALFLDPRPAIWRCLRLIRTELMMIRRRWKAFY